MPSLRFSNPRVAVAYSFSSDEERNLAFMKLNQHHKRVMFQKIGEKDILISLTGENSTDSKVRNHVMSLGGQRRRKDA